MNKPFSIFVRILDALMAPPKKILVAPLDWGLGHATRCIPIIHALLKKSCEVIIGADKRPLALLRKEFPHIEYVVMPGYDISYSASGSMAGNMLLSVSKILIGIKREHKLLKKLIKEKKINAVISDNRYGLYSGNIPSVFLTHQLFIQSPILSSLLRSINHHYIDKFTECWVPDSHNEINLSGALSHGYPLPSNTYYIGNLSRFNNTMVDHNHRIDLLCIISGPEPQRTIFEKNILEQVKKLDHKLNLKIVIVQGKPDVDERKFISQHIELISHLDAKEMNTLIVASKLILSRPGYSTIMDIAALNKKAIFVPTHGQTEQEYLALKFKKEKVAYSVDQNKFNLKDAINENVNYNGFTQHNPTNDLEKKIDSFLAEIRP